MKHKSFGVVSTIVTRLAGALLITASVLTLLSCATQIESVKSASLRQETFGGPPRKVIATDPPTRTALLRIAQRFNDNYDNGSFGAVWDRWDRRSHALISRAEYIRRHEVCAPATDAVAKVEGAEPVGNGAWHVHYEIEGVQLVDTWYYHRGRWLFDILQSNPKAAEQYAMPFGRYAAAVGCSIH